VRFPSPLQLYESTSLVEQSFVAWAKMRARRLPPVKLGIGDDAAVLSTDGSDIVITTDSLMDGVHFESAKVSPRRIGRKLMGVNLSDLAAMAAEPQAVFLSLCLPTGDGIDTEGLAAEIFEGVCEMASEYAVAIAGGDTNCWTGPLVLHLTAVGTCQPGVAWTRAGAQPEDLIVVSGPLGGSLLGKHLDFTPRIDLAKQLRGQVDVHAAMDISDGLSVDLLRMCDASRCGAILDLSQIPISQAAHHSAATSGKLPVEHALGDGEDFELLMAIAPQDFEKLQQVVGPQNAISCGVFTSRTGLWARENGSIRQLTSSGYVHGR
jgi:thiamine-monophosphate kinase